MTLSPGTTNRLSDGGSATGAFTNPATSLVEWSGLAYTLNAGAQLNGAGLYQVSGTATVTANTNVSFQNLNLTLSSTLAGTGTVTVNNVLNWTGGTMSGSGRTLIPPGASLNLANASPLTLVRTLENAGTALWTGSANINGSGTVITNDAGALFEAQNNASFSYLSGGPCRFDNAGTFRKDTGVGTSTFGLFFSLNNYGAIEVQTGTLLCNDVLVNNGTVTLSPGTTNRLSDGGSATGTFTNPATSLVEWSGLAYTLNAGAQLNGAGLYQVSGTATLTANTNVSLQNLNLILSSTLAGTGTVTVNNVLNWTGGTMSGSGRTLIPPGASLNLANASALNLLRTLENAGTALWTGSANINGSGTVITNDAGALFEMQNNASFTYLSGGTCRFDNAGTFRKDTGTGTSTFGLFFSLNNYNTVDIRTGILAASGGYSPSSGSSLICTLGGTSPGTGYAQLQAAGTVALNGALSVVLTNGYIPTTNDTFTVLTAGTRTGTFAGFSYPSNQVTMQLSNTTSSVIALVTAVAAPPPQPLLLSPVLSGTNVLLTWTAVSNATYRIEFDPNLAPSNWTALPGDVTGASNTASKFDTLTPSNRFYRVHVIP